MNRKTLNKLTIPNSPHCLPQIFFKLLKRIQSLVMIIKFTMLVAFDPYFTCKPAGDQVSAISELRPVYTGVFCRGNSMQFFSVALKLQLQNRTCKPGEIFSAICLRDIGGFEHVRNLKLHRVAATKIACVNGPLDLRRSWIFLCGKKSAFWALDFSRPLISDMDCLLLYSSGDRILWFVCRAVGKTGFFYTATVLCRETKVCKCCLTLPVTPLYVFQ